jgi:hypothetical protein
LKDLDAKTSVNLVDGNTIATLTGTTVADFVTVLTAAATAGLAGTEAATIGGTISAADANSVANVTSGIVTAAVTAGTAAALNGALGNAVAGDLLTLTTAAGTDDISSLVALNGKTGIAVVATATNAITDTTNIGANLTTAGITWGATPAITTGTAATFTSNQTSHVVAAGNIADDTTLTLAGSAIFTVTGLVGDIASTSTGGMAVTLASVATSTVAFGTDTTGTHTVNANALTNGQELTLTGSDIGAVTLVGGDLDASTYAGVLTVTATSGTNEIKVGSAGSIVTGGAGADTITLGTGIDTLKRNGDGSTDGSDTVIGFSITSETDVIDLITNGATDSVTGYAELATGTINTGTAMLVYTANDLPAATEDGIEDIFDGTTANLQLAAASDVLYLAASDGTHTYIFEIVAAAGNAEFTAADDVATLMITLNDMTDASALSGANFLDFA